MRSKDSITIQWEEGVSNGGRIVVDFRVSYAETSSDIWLTSAETVTRQMYWTISGLTSGVTYKFRVEARN
jgi:hypothetical protein